MTIVGVSRSNPAREEWLAPCEVPAYQRGNAPSRAPIELDPFKDSRACSNAISHSSATASWVAASATVGPVAASAEPCNDVGDGRDRR